VPAAIDGAIDPDWPLVEAGETQTLEAPDAKARLEPMEGWAKPAGENDVLTLTRGSAVVTVQVAGQVGDVDVFFDRYVRTLRVRMPSPSLPDLSGLQMTEMGPYTAGSGLSGVQGAALSTGERGQLIALADEEAAVAILSLAAPGQADSYEDQLEQTIDSVEIER
jgi:hypothetical protein